MTASDFLPNWEIIKQPWNWVVVAICVGVLLLILHAFFRNTVAANTVSAQNSYPQPPSVFSPVGPPPNTY